MKGRKVRAERSASAGSVHTERKTVAPGRRRTAGCGTMASSQRRMQSHRRTRVSLRSAFLSFLFFPFFHFALTPLFFLLFLVYSLRDLSRSFPKKRIIQSLCRISQHDMDVQIFLSRLLFIYL